MCHHYALGCLLGTLVLAAQVDPVRSAYGGIYACTSDAECQYEGCNDRSCVGHEFRDKCTNGFWEALCYAGYCRFRWDGWSYNYYPEPWLDYTCPDPPHPLTTTPEPIQTTTPTPTTVAPTVESTLSSPAPDCEPVEKIVEKIIYKSWQEDPGRKDWGRPGHSHCVQPYTWGELVDGYKDKYIPYKVGGLGQRLETGGYETWICLLNDHPCGDPHYCWVYHETHKLFTAWGTNTELGLHFK